MRTLSFFVIVSFTLVALPARAESDQARNKAAKTACLTGDFRKGAQILVQLYLSTGQPTHLFNQGRCYEQNHRWQEAVDAFREYLRKAASLTVAEKTDTERHIADCEAFLAKENAERHSQVTGSPVQPPLPPPTPDIPAAAPTTQTSPGAETTASVREHSPTTSNGKGSGLRVAGLVTGGFGLAATVAGIALNLKANQLADQVNQHYSQAKDSSHSTYSTLSWVGYGVGAAAIAAGATLYLIGWNRGQADSGNSMTLALTPILGPGETRLILKGAF